MTQMRDEAMETARPRRQGVGCANVNGTEHPDLRVDASGESLLGQEEDGWELLKAGPRCLNV